MPPPPLRTTNVSIPYLGIIRGHEDDEEGDTAPKTEMHQKRKVPGGEITWGLGGGGRDGTGEIYLWYYIRYTILKCTI